MGLRDGVQDGRLADEYSQPNLPTERRLKDGIKTRVVSVFASSCRCSRLAEGEFVKFVSEGEIYKSYERFRTVWEYRIW